MDSDRAHVLPLLRAPDQALATYGKTFHWASRALGASTARRTRSFYAFCRYADDLADELEPEVARPLLERLLEELKRKQTSDPVLAEFLLLARELDLDLSPARELVQAVRSDHIPARFETVAELLRYAHGVAGTVGLVMCQIFGAKDPRARLFAVDLGIAMQLTNIARDVLDDAHKGRLYLPVEWLGGALQPEDLIHGRGTARLRARLATNRVLQLADRYYRSADLGMRFLPLRARIAVLVASRCYEAIGPRVRRAGPWQGRARVGLAGKCVHTVRALIAGAWITARQRMQPALPQHDARLHRDLSGLAGIAGSPA